MANPWDIPTGKYEGKNSKGKVVNWSVQQWANDGNYPNAKKAYLAAPGSNKNTWTQTEQHLRWNYDTPEPSYRGTIFWQPRSKGKATPDPGEQSSDDDDDDDDDPVYYGDNPWDIPPGTNSDGLSIQKLAKDAKYIKAKALYIELNGDPNSWEDTHQHLRWAYQGDTYEGTPFSDLHPNWVKDDDVDDDVDDDKDKVDDSGDDDVIKAGGDTDIADTRASGDPNIWSTEGLEGDYGPTVTKGLFGFSDENPATVSKNPYSYLNAYNIGQNLAYKPWHPAAWTGPDADTNYGGIPGGTDTRDQLYYYGGEKPMQVPGGWKPAPLPGGAKSVYPIARTPLGLSGALSGKGPLPGAATVVDDDKTDDDKTDDDKTGGDTKVNSFGALLSQYANRMGTKGKYLYSVTDEPYKVSGVKGGTGPDKSYSTYRVPLTIWGGEKGPEKTFATRLSSSEGWDPSMNQWSVRTNSDQGRPGMSLQFADWAGAKDSYTSSNVGKKYNIFAPWLTQAASEYKYNVGLRDPDSNMLTGNIPYAAYDWGGPTWAKSQQPTAFTEDAFKYWGLPTIYGQSGKDSGFSENILGYDLPEWRNIWTTGTDTEDTSDEKGGSGDKDW